MVVNGCATQGLCMVERSNESIVQHPMDERVKTKYTKSKAVCKSSSSERVARVSSSYSMQPL